MNNRYFFLSSEFLFKRVVNYMHMLAYIESLYTGGIIECNEFWK